MTQLFMGVKPGVGPVVKILKNNGDNPLTLANDAYDKYLFNSENQQLSHTFGNFTSTYHHTTYTADGRYYVGGSSSTAPYVISADVYSNIKVIRTFGRLDKIYPNRPFLPMPEFRSRFANARYTAGRRSLSLYRDEVFYEEGIVVSYQFNSGLGKVQNLDEFGGGDYWNLYAPTGAGISVGDWVALGVGGARGYTTTDSITSTNAIVQTFNYWNLPADSSPMPTYTYASNQEMLRLNSSEFILTRPGYAVSGSSGPHERIIDSTIGPALCVAAGVTPAIPASSTYTITIPTGITLSSTAVVDFMIKKEGGTQYIPCHVEAGYVHDDAFSVTYEIDGDEVIIYNNGTGSVVVTYFVFNSSDEAPSTGGNLILFRGNDGTQDFIQIKKPGTTDPASKATDILLDTRLPTLHILAEGYIPLASFTDPPENVNTLGKVAKQINFDASGMIPFVKYTIVFPNHIMSPSCTLYYRWGGGSPSWGPPTNQSALCRLSSNNAKFWLNPGNFSRLVISGGSVDMTYDLPDPIGIRYYIFGIPT